MPEQGRIDPKIGTAISRDFHKWLQTFSQKYVLLPNSSNEILTELRINERMYVELPAIEIELQFGMEYKTGDAKQMNSFRQYLYDELQSLADKWKDSYGCGLHHINIDQHGAYGTNKEVDYEVTLGIVAPDGELLPALKDKS